MLGSEARVPLEVVTEAANPTTIIAHECTPFTEAALQAEQIDALIGQDPEHLVRSAMRILRARCDRREILASQEKIRIENFIRENLYCAVAGRSETLASMGVTGHIAWARDTVSGRG